MVSYLFEVQARVSFSGGINAREVHIRQPVRLSCVYNSADKNRVFIRRLCQIWKYHNKTSATLFIIAL